MGVIQSQVNSGLSTIGFIAGMTPFAETQKLKAAQDQQNKQEQLEQQATQESLNTLFNNRNRAYSRLIETRQGLRELQQKKDLSAEDKKKKSWLRTEESIRVNQDTIASRSYIDALVNAVERFPSNNEFAERLSGEQFFAETLAQEQVQRQAQKNHMNEMRRAAYARKKAEQAKSAAIQSHILDANNPNAMPGGLK